MNTSKRIRLPRISTIIACVALFAALSGSALAAKHLITGKQVAKNTLKGKHVKDGSLTENDLSDAAVAAFTKDTDTDTDTAGLVGPAGGALAGSFPNPSIAANAVASPAIKDGGVGAADIAANAVGAKALADNSVDTGALQENSVHSSDIANGSVTGDDLAIVRTVVPKSSASTSFDKNVSADCPGTSTPVGATASIDNQAAGVAVTGTFQIDGNTWGATASELVPQAGNWAVQIELVCLSL